MERTANNVTIASFTGNVGTVSVTGSGQFSVNNAIYVGENVRAP